MCHLLSLLRHSLGLLPWRCMLMSSPRSTVNAQGLHLHLLSSLLPRSLDLLQRGRLRMIFVIVVLYVLRRAMASPLLLLVSRPPTERLLFIRIGSMPRLRRLLLWSALVLGIYKIKTRSNGSLERYKASACFQQEHGCDYDETFAPVAHVTTVQTLLDAASIQHGSIF